MELEGTCLNCGRNLKGLQTKFCGLACKRTYYRTKRMAGATVYKRKCEYCGTEFETTNWRKTFCNPNCARALRMSKPVELELEAKETPKISLNEAARMARAQGKTYGELFQREVTVVFPWYGG